MQVTKHFLTHSIKKTLTTGILVALLVLMLFGRGAPGSAQEEQSNQQLDIVLVLDQSNSMVQGNDTGGLRLIAADLFLDLLGIDQRGGPHQVGVLMFGEDVEWVGNLQDITNEGVRGGIKQAMRDKNTNMNYTNIPDALQLALQELDGKGREGAKKAIVFLSDGVCDLPGTEYIELSACNNQIRKLYIRNEGEQVYPIYTIALSRGAFQTSDKFQTSQNLWEEIAHNTDALYFPVISAEEGLLDAYTKIIFDLLNLPGEELPPPVIVPYDVELVVPEGLGEALFFAYKSDPTVESMLIHPDGTLIGEGQPDQEGVRISSGLRTDTYSVLKPEPGTWTMRLTGRGTARVLGIQVPNLDVIYLQPAADHPLGKPMDIILQLQDDTGSAVTVPMIALDIQRPDGSMTPVSLVEGPQTSYLGRLDLVDQEGEYTLNLQAEQGDGQAPINHVREVQVKPAPWLQVISPQAGATLPAGQPIAVIAQPMIRQQTITQPGVQDQFELWTELFAPGGQGLGRVPLAPAGDGSYIAQLPAPEAGDFLLVADMVYTDLTTGEVSTDKVELPVQVGLVAPPPPKDTSTPTDEPTATPTLALTPTVTHTPLPPTLTPTITPTPVPPPPPEPPSPAAIGGIVGLLILLAGGGGAAYWWFSKPSLAGALDGSSGYYGLSGKGALEIGSGPKSKIFLDDPMAPARAARLKAVGSRKNPMVEIQSLDEANQVIVNNMPVNNAVLNDGDDVKIGKYTFKYKGPLGAGDLDFGQDNFNDPFTGR
jgi:hypothetical protein